MKFVACAPEDSSGGECLGDEECGPGSRCNHDVCLPPPGCNWGDPCPPVCYGRCEPAQNGCDLVDCQMGFHCEVVCADDPGNGGGSGGGKDCGYPNPCPSPPPEPCTPVCVPDDDHPVGECSGPVACDSLPPACPPTTVPGVANGCWTGYCIPVAACGHDPGTCFHPGDPICRSLPPACPSGTVPGVINACWSGYCIPDFACEPPATCEALGDEAACRARTDCRPVFEGVGCTCDANGVCECRERKFQRCEASFEPPLP